MTETLDRIHHIALTVSDVANAVAWYCNNLKCKVIHHDYDWALLEFANTHLALTLPGKHAPHIGIANDHPELFDTPKLHRDGTSYVYITDPSGNTLEMIKPVN